MNALTPSIWISVGRMWCGLLWSLARFNASTRKGEPEHFGNDERNENTRGHDHRRASKTLDSSFSIRFPAVKLFFPSYFLVDAPLSTMSSNHDIRPPDMRRDVQEIFRSTPHHKQVMMFSATLSKEIRVTCKKFMANVSRHELDLLATFSLVSTSSPSKYSSTTRRSSLYTDFSSIMSSRRKCRRTGS
jgi:hypothetical protein